jgi:hypothetical protein
MRYCTPEEINTKVAIEKAPAQIDLSAFELSKGKCHLNSYQIASEHPDCLIVEGILVADDNTQGRMGKCHVWNKLGEIYFDGTYEKLWADDPRMKESGEIFYFPVIEYTVEDLKSVSIFEFSTETIEQCDELNKYLKNQFEKLKALSDDKDS